MTRLAASPIPDAATLARDVKVRVRDKHDHYLGEELLSAAYAARIPGAGARPPG